MRAGRWAAMNVRVGEALAELKSDLLTVDERRRLALAWLEVYLAGGDTEDDWRRALGYNAEDWAPVRSRFADVLERDGVWTLRFLRSEAARQRAVSAEQTRRSLKRWEPRHPGGEPETPDPAGLGVHAAASHGIPPGSHGMNIHAAGSPASASASKTDSKPTPSPNGSDLVLTAPPSRNGHKPEAREWLEAFESHFWPAYRSQRNAGKAAALEVWKRIEPKTQAHFEKIWHGLQSYISGEWRGKDPQYVPHARTWLFQKRWLDHAEGT